MKRRTGGILLTAFLVAGLCTLLVSYLVARRFTPGNRPTGSTAVAAVANIRIGTVLSPADLKTIEIVGSLPDSAIRDPKNAIGRGVLSDLYAGEPILETRLAAPGSGGGLAATIPAGMRVCAVKVDEVVGVAGFVTPGMRVDVLISGTPPGTTNDANGPEVRTLLQNIEVKSAGTDIQKDDEGKPKQVQVVNLLVAPDQAESLSLAGSQTRIQLVLRNPLDTQISRVNGNSMGKLFGDRSTTTKLPVIHKELKKPASDIYTVEVINGSKGSIAKFAASGEKR
jgi:pilus assembly protein CpaB